MTDTVLTPYKIALAQSAEMLSDTDFSQYDVILFVGKSIGTVVAAEIASRSPVPERIHFVLYTPLEQTFSFPLGDAIAFTGDADPWVKAGIIPELCLVRDIPGYIIPGSNHSLETGSVKEDKRLLQNVCGRVCIFYISDLTVNALLSSA